MRAKRRGRAGDSLDLNDVTLSGGGASYDC